MLNFNTTLLRRGCREMLTYRTDPFKTHGFNPGTGLLCFRVFLEKMATEVILVMRVDP